MRKMEWVLLKWISIIIMSCNVESKKSKPLRGKKNVLMKHVRQLNFFFLTKSLENASVTLFASWET